MLGFALLFIISFGAMAATPPEQSTVDKYVELALSTDVDVLQGSGKHDCKYSFLVNNYGKDPEYAARGKTIKIAQQNLALQCIKDRCQHVGKWISTEMDNLALVSQADITEFLRSLNLDSQTKAIIENLQQRDKSNISSITCETSTPTARMTVVDSCFVLPMLCR